MRMYVENIDTNITKGFNSIKGACEYAFNNKASKFETLLIHNGYYNFCYAENFETFKDLYNYVLNDSKDL